MTNYEKNRNDHRQFQRGHFGFSRFFRRGGSSSLSVPAVDRVKASPWLRSPIRQCFDFRARGRRRFPFAQRSQIHHQPQ